MNNLFIKFFMIKLEIANAADKQEMDVVAKLRQELMSLWNAIISIQPDTLEERKILGLFLLDQLTDKTPEYEVKLIRKKIIELFWQAPCEQSQSDTSELTLFKETA